MDAAEAILDATEPGTDLYSHQQNIHIHSKPKLIIKLHQDLPAGSLRETPCGGCALLTLMLIIDCFLLIKAFKFCKCFCIDYIPYPLKHVARYQGLHQAELS
jgi:hypothetical protein